MFEFLIFTAKIGFAITVFILFLLIVVGFVLGKNPNLLLKVLSDRLKKALPGFSSVEHLGETVVAVKNSDENGER